MPRFTSRLNDAHALVTGGTKGLGRGMTEAFLAEGCNVSYCSRNATGSEYSDFQDAPAGTRAVGSVVDIMDPEAIKAWVDKAASEFGRIDVVVANAHPFHNQPTLEDWQKCFQATILGLVTLIEATTPYLEKQKGSIIVISSLAGFELKHHDVASPYTTLKRAQATLAKDYMRKLAPLEVRINCILPGAVGNSANSKAGTDQESTFEKTLRLAPEKLKEYAKLIPMGHFGDIKDIGNLAVFLASPMSKYMTGNYITVDGGMSTAL